MSNVKKLRNELACAKADLKNIERFLPPWPDAGAGHRHVFDGEYVRETDQYWDPTQRQWVLVHSSMVGIEVSLHKCFVRRKCDWAEDYKELRPRARKISDYPVMGAETGRFVACDFESLHQAITVVREQLNQTEMKSIKHAACIHAESLDAKERIWRETKASVADQIQAAALDGLMMVKVKCPPRFYATDVLVEHLKSLGYTATESKGEDAGILVSWRTAKLS